MINLRRRSFLRGLLFSAIAPVAFAFGSHRVEDLSDMIHNIKDPEGTVVFYNMSYYLVTDPQPLVISRPIGDWDDT